MSNNVEQQMLILIGEITAANDSYYGKEDTLYTDLVYDQKKKELAVLASSNVALAKKHNVESILSAVGYRVNTNLYTPMIHTPPMLSLDNCYTEEDVSNWKTRTTNASQSQYIVTPKYDGTAFELVYKDGKLIQGGTRGDGETGEDWTATCLASLSIPETITLQREIKLRGEILLSWDNLEKVKEIDEKEYMNPRNAATGIARRKTPGEATKYLDFVVYDVLIEESRKTFKYLSGALDYAALLGFLTASYTLVDTLEDIMKAIQDVEQSRANHKYMLDGAVIRIDSNEIYSDLGATSHHPRAATAFKYAAERVEVRLMDVEWTRGKKGKLSPNARLAKLGSESDPKPVLLAGTNVQNALLHTMKIINTLDVKIGDVVIIEKAAEIIPQVVGVRHDLRTGAEKDIIPPSVCPIYGTPTVLRGEYVYSNGPVLAKDILLTYLDHTGFKGIGPSAASKLGENGSFTKITDLYHLSKEDLVNAGVAAKNADKYISSIKDSIGTLKPKNILAGLSIDMCGRGTSEDLIEEAGHTIKDLCWKDAKWFEGTKDIGEKTAKSLSLWFNDPVNVDLVETLYSLGVIIDSNSIVKRIVSLDEKELIGDLSGLPLHNMQVCITGTLVRDTRPYYIGLIEANGGIYVDKFKKSIDVLLVGENAGSKKTKAEASNIPVWTEEYFMNRINI